MLLKNNIKVLLFDDINANRSCLKVLLKFFGIHNIIEVSDFNIAINKINSDSFDLVFIGSKMFSSSNKDSLKVLKEMKNQKNPNIKVIAFNDENKQVNISNYTKYGVDKFLRRPFDQKYLYSNLDKIMA